ncbi:PREDICTED: beta-1,3-galactosyl-O-glycosyl-glycoprotein beta-1,6-N-acetylglucosaminyltransferase 3 [Lepidothrix coronata]|uniref:Beta-1,3-galactosyl-O-glycosyl-glycoprotein beta-1,6-N-acetylglucosaminyltransferase 3 n=1 Tax=Lepidothrix coronata TaxID=321398 RepID=A0A6J0HDI0_9PASS|nr:PREDICTED: beta-1,3-galactosyl-O-glycosyl-glycoprotein beta-1,6-N-acetylglucosaminyltransferase 3 [Lepidothrix coronata]
MRLWERAVPGARRRWALLLPPLALLAAALALREAARPCPADRPRCRQRLYRALELPPGRGINCSGIVRGDRRAIEEAQLRNLEVANRRAPLTPGHYLNMTRDCSAFRQTRRFIEFPLSQEEAEFPIAYSMVIHNKIEMFERLLRSLYAPQNVYCVHVDSKSPAAFQEAVRAIAGCFPNVFVASRLENVVYASWSRLQADLNCMRDLLRSPVPWRYLLNTCGTDFPIKTNAEIVRALKVLQGRNSMESEKPSAAKRVRWQFHHEVGKAISRTDIEKLPPPLNCPMFTGNAYIVVTRGFVRHLFENPTAQKFLEWSKDTYSPDEHVWATLNRMPGVPGAVPHNDKFQLSDMNALPRLVKWAYLEGDPSKGAPYPPCTGRHQRSVCIYGAGDLPWMLQQHHLLANKFDPEVDDAAILCLEEHLRHRALYGRGL